WRLRVGGAGAEAEGGSLAVELRAFQEGAAIVLPALGAGVVDAGPIGALEPLLQIGHKAPDDRRALEAICEELLTRLRAATVLVGASHPERRTFAVVGRPWPGDPEIVGGAMPGASRIAPDRHREPCEAAEPLRYAGDVIAAVACRWTPGTTIDEARTLGHLHAGSLALAPHVRACLDRALPTVP